MRWVVLLGVAACGRIDFDAIGARDASGSDGTPDTRAADIRFVQTMSTAAPTGSMSATVTLPAKPTPGNLLVITASCFQFDGQAALEANSAQDSGSGDVPMIIHEVTTNGCLGRGKSIAIYAGLATAASSGVVTLTPQPVNTSEISMTVAEYSGVATLDDSTSLVTGPGTSPQMLGTGQTDDIATVPELAVAVGTDCSGDPNPQTWTDEGGYDVAFNQTDLTTHVPVISTRKILTTTGPAEDTWTVAYSGPDGNAYGAIATFK